MLAAPLIPSGDLQDDDVPLNLLAILIRYLRYNLRFMCSPLCRAVLVVVSQLRTEQPFPVLTELE